MSFLDDTFGKLKYEDEGKWIEYAKNPDGSIPRVKVRRAHSRNHAYQAGVASILSRNKGKKIKGAVDDRVTAEAYSKFLIIVWENILCPDSLLETFSLNKGDFIPFSKQNAFKLMMERPRFLDDIHRTVNNEDFFDEDAFDEEAADEETVKN